MSNLRQSHLPALQAAQAADPGGQLPPAVAASPEASVSLTDVDSAATFRPTEAQVRVKAKFWAKWAEQPLLNAQQPTLSLVQSITGSASVKGWWTRAGFVDWFLNTRVTDERLEYLLHLALSAAEDILLNDDPRTAGYRVSMIKTVAEMAGRVGTGARPAPAQAAAAAARGRFIESASKEDLVKLLESSGLRVEQVVTLPPKSQEP